jgi:hypothetical protein
MSGSSIFAAVAFVFIISLFICASFYNEDE